MSKPELTPNIPQISKKSLLLTVLGTIAAAALLLVFIVLPAEYGTDLSGFGKLTGLTGMASAPTTTITIRDVTGGNATLREVKVPDAGKPTPLPNPAVFQDEPQVARKQTLRIEIPPSAETEIKAHMTEGKVMIYSWQVEEGGVYIDFHGHDPSFGPEFFVRYQEIQEGATHSSGSLTAPFTGEHGWYWLNYNDFPVVITLEVSGFYDEIIDYGIF